MAEGIEGRLNELEERLALLELVLRDLRSELAHELATERVTVLDEAGVPRVVLSARYDTGSVLVRAPGPDGETTGVELFVTARHGEAPTIGLAIFREGNMDFLLDGDERD